MPSEIRVLTVRQPWAWAIIHGGKDVENRSRNLAGKYRGPVAIHVAQAEDVNAFSLSPCRDALNAAAGLQTASADWWNNHGRIIGVVDLVHVHPERFYNSYCGCLSEWADVSCYHMVLEHPRPLAEPILYRGGQGLRRFNETVDADVLRQLAELTS